MPNNWQSPFAELAYFIRNFLLRLTTNTFMSGIPNHSLLSPLLKPYEKFIDPLQISSQVNAHDDGGVWCMDSDWERRDVARSTWWWRRWDCWASGCCCWPPVNCHYAAINDADWQLHWRRRAPLNSVNILSPSETFRRHCDTGSSALSLLCSSVADRSNFLAVAAN